MEWYELSSVAERFASIEQFLIEIAANEERVSLNGFPYALTLPSADPAAEALLKFNEDFSNLRRLIARIDKTYFAELETLEENGKVVEQVALVGLQVRMAKAKTVASKSISIVAGVLDVVPYFSKLIPRRSIFGEAQISLQRTIINLGRLRSIVEMFSEYVSNRMIEDDEIFKPSNISADKVVQYIDQAMEELDASTSLPEKEVLRLKAYLLEAKKEALSNKPSWTRVVGALVIVAAVTSGLNDAPGAAKNVREAIEYVLGTSVVKPLLELLPNSIKTGDAGQSKGVA